MNHKHYRRLALLALSSALLPALGQAATPQVMLEKSATYALGNKVQSYLVPTVDVNGAVKYYDVTVTLGVNNDGTLLPSAGVSSVLSPLPITGVMVPGTYTQDSDINRICTVSNVNLTGGRIQSFFSCSPTYYPFQFSVVTGPITTGHPYLAELVAAGVDKRSDVSSQTWGVVTNASVSMNGCGNGNYNSPTPIGVKTNGKNIILSVYSKSTPSAFLCGGGLTKK